MENSQSADLVFGTLNAALNATYRYDGLDRLTSASKGASAWGYTFDGVGNRLTRTVNGSIITHGYVAGSHRLALLAGALVAVDGS